jgi:hypothetical protein
LTGDDVFGIVEEMVDNVFTKMSYEEIKEKRQKVEEEELDLRVL